MAEFPTKSPGEVVTAADWNQIEDYVDAMRPRATFSDPEVTVTSAMGTTDVGDPVTDVVIGPSGRVLLALSFHFEFDGGASSSAVFGRAVYSGPDSGTTSTFVWGRNSPTDFRKSVQAQFIQSGLTPGTYSFQPRISVSSNEAEFRLVTITATPLP